MSQPSFITVKMLEQKLVWNYFALSGRLPVSLHAWPRWSQLQSLCAGTTKIVSMFFFLSIKLLRIKDES